MALLFDSRYTGRTASVCFQSLADKIIPLVYLIYCPECFAIASSTPGNAPETCQYGLLCDGHLWMGRNRVVLLSTLCSSFIIHTLQQRLWIV